MDEQGKKPGALEIGLGVAVAVAVAALMGLQILVVPRFAEMYREFGATAVLPILTRATLLGAVPVGGAVAALGLGAAGALAWRRGAEGQGTGTGALGAALLGAGVVVGLGAMALALYGLYAPIFELAGKIKP